MLNLRVVCLCLFERDEHHWLCVAICVQNWQGDIGIDG